MRREVGFGEFIREVSLQQQSISYNDLTPKLERDNQGREIPYRPKKIELRGIDVYRLLGPYLSVRFVNQVRAVVPLAIYLVLFQLLVLRQSVVDHWIIMSGLFAVIVGLMIFMEGLKLGLMPFAEIIGDHLPKKSTLKMVMLIAFTLGIGVTFAEPAIGALQAVGSIVDLEKAPYLYALLNDWTGFLVLAVGAGVGLAAMLGTLRFLNGWSLKPMIYLSLLPAILLTIYCLQDDDLSKVIGLAWDCGAVTTGPVTVPLVLALGIGIASAAGKGSSSLSGFGIVTLASVFPIIAVLILAVCLSFFLTPEEIISSAKAASLSGVSVAETPWYEKTPFVEVILGVRAIVPLVLFLFFILKMILKEKLAHSGIVTYGLTLTVFGMVVFNLGLSYGLAKLGAQSGSIVPSAFTVLEDVKNSPLYNYPVGIALALIFAWVLGFGATLAEPALNALGQTVENLTNGAFRQGMLMYAVSIGVAFGIMLGIVKIVFGFSIAYMLIPGYALAVVLTMVSTEEFVNIAWDSAGVTTGPITVPLVLAMGLGFGDAVSAVEGFGILSMASICPILSVLLTGILVKAKMRRLEKILSDQAEKVGVPAI